MASYICGICEIMIVAKPGDDGSVLCPSCNRPMIPKSGPGSSEINFPDHADPESVLNLPVPEEIKAVEEKKRLEKMKRLEMLEKMEKEKRDKKKK